MVRASLMMYLGIIEIVLMYITFQGKVSLYECRYLTLFAFHNIT